MGDVEPIGVVVEIPPRNLLATGASRGMQPRYMGRFSCIGERCEDSCCSGWAIPISRQDHRRLQVVLGEEGLARVAQRAGAKERPRNEWTPGFARFAQGPDKRCCYLGDDALCGLQVERGEAALTNVCDQYPRHQHQFDETVERTATLACPEAARLCLLDEHAMELTAFDITPGLALSRPAIKLRDSKDAHLSRFERVRGAMFEVMGDRSHAVGDRLCALLVMTESLKPTFKRGRSPNDEVLERELTKLRSPAFLEELSQSLEMVPAKGSAVVVLLSYILTIYSESAGSRMAKVLERVRSRYHLGKSAKEALLEDPLFEEISYSFEQAKRQTSRFSERIDTYFTHYAQNYLLQVPFFDQGALKPYVLELTLRVATLRFLFLSDEKVAAACAEEDEAAARDQLDAAAVEVFQSFAREIEHAPAFSNKLHTLLDRIKVNALGDLVCLSRL